MTMRANYNGHSMLIHEDAGYDGPGRFWLRVDGVMQSSSRDLGGIKAEADTAIHLDPGVTLKWEETA